MYVGGIQDDTGLRGYIASVERFPTLDRRAELQLARRWRRDGDRKAADRLVEANLRYVVQIASRYRGYGIRLADLVEEGNLGLLEAVRRFEPERKLRFMTYASFWVRAYILAHVLKQWSIVGMGSSPKDSKMFFRLHGARARMVQKLGSESDTVDAELATQFGTSEERIRNMSQRLAGHDTSLDVQAFRDGGQTLLDLLSDERPDQEQHAAAVERDEQVRTKVAAEWDRLDARERLIVEERLMASDDAVSLADLGRRLGLSRERVRQLEERVKSKLRTALQTVA